MLRDKNTIKISEMKNFFTSTEKASSQIFSILRSLKFSYKFHNKVESNKTTYKSNDILLLLLIFPLLDIKNAFVYEKSPLHKMFSCGKDVFYRLKNDTMINWKLLLYSFSLKLIKIAQKKAEQTGEHHRCLIVDDTDFPKTGRNIELIGRIWSHVTQRSILGFKGLFLGYFDGKSFYGLDFSLHGEKGKNEKKPYGLTKKQLNERYSKKRAPSTAGYQREQEYFLMKTQSLIAMIRLAISKGIRFEYLLVDSWFTSDALIRFITTRKIGCHLLGMVKMGKSRYVHNAKALTTKEIINDLKKKKKVKKSKLLNVWSASAIVDYKGIKVKLFFCKTTHRGNWNALLSTNLDLNFEEAYKIYATRWTIEVFFKESKQYFGLGKSQSLSFDAQIADTTISIMQYNTLSLAKRFLDYESLGKLFKEAKAETIMLTIAEQIWEYLLEILAIIAEIFEIELELILEKLVDENVAVMNLINWRKLDNAA